MLPPPAFNCLWIGDFFILFIDKRSVDGFAWAMAKPLNLDLSTFWQGCAKMTSRIGGSVSGGNWKYAHGTAHYGRNFSVKWLKVWKLSHQLPWLDFSEIEIIPEVIPNILIRLWQREAKITNFWAGSTFKLITFGI